MFTKRKNKDNFMHQDLKKKEAQRENNKPSSPDPRVSETEIRKRAIETVMASRGQYQTTNFFREVGQSDSAKCSNAGMMTIGQQVEVNGKIEEFDGLEILGSFVGELSGERLTIGKLGNVDAKVSVETLVVEGHLKGEVQVSSRAIIRSTGKFGGQLEFGSIEVEGGGEITGHLKVRTIQSPIQEEDAIELPGKLSRISAESGDSSSEQGAAQIFKNFPKPETKVGGLEG